MNPIIRFLTTLRRRASRWGARFRLSPFLTGVSRKVGRLFQSFSKGMRRISQPVVSVPFTILETIIELPVLVWRTPILRAVSRNIGRLIHSFSGVMRRIFRPVLSVVGIVLSRFIKLPAGAGLTPDLAGLSNKIVGLFRNFFERLRSEPRLVVLVACILLASIMPIWQCGHDAPILRDATTIDQAQIARNAARGKGLQTSIIQPLAVTMHPELFKGGLRPYPELYYPPVPLIATGVAMALFGENASTVRWCAVAMFIATFLVTFYLARELFGFGAGLMAMLLVALNPYPLSVCQAGSLRFFSIFALLISLLWTLKARRKPYSWKPAFALGMAWGMVILCDYTLVLPSLTVVALQPYLRDSLPDRDRIRWSLRVWGGMLLVLVPWLLRNWRVAGSPLAAISVFELVSGTRDFPGGTVFRSTEAVVSSAWGLLFAHGSSTLLKWIGNAGYLWEMMSQVTPSLLLGFVLVLWLQKQLTAESRKAMNLLLLVSVGVIVSSLVSIWTPERVLTCGPLMTILSVAGLMALARSVMTYGTPVEGGRPGGLFSTPLKQRLLYGAVIALCAWPLAARTISSPGPGSGYQPRYQQFAQFLAPEAVVASDVPWSVAWNGDRTAVLLPTLTRRDATTFATNLQVDAVHVSPFIFSYGRQEQMGAYQTVATGLQNLNGFQRPVRLAEGGVLLVRSDKAKPEDRRTTPRRGT